jgi:hypothetical protein
MSLIMVRFMMGSLEGGRSVYKYLRSVKGVTMLEAIIVAHVAWPRTR